jgi:hypothetical protein
MAPHNPRSPSLMAALIVTDGTCRCRGFHRSFTLSLAENRQGSFPPGSVGVTAALAPRHSSQHPGTTRSGAPMSRGPARYGVALASAGFLLAPLPAAGAGADAPDIGTGGCST